MNNSGATLAEYSAKNRKKAYFAMCRVSLLLLFFTFSSMFLSDALLTFLYDKESDIVNVTVRMLALLGVEKQISYAAVKMLLSSTAFYEVLSVAMNFITMVLPAALFSKYVHLSSEECFNISGKTVKWFVPLFFTCQMFTTLASVLSDTIYSFLVPESAMVFDAHTGVVASEFDAYEFVLQILCSCILVPLVEEYVFRGVIFSYLKRYGLTFAAVASAAVFGIAHSSPTQSVYAFVFGLFSAFLVVVTGNIKTSIIFHGLNNFLIVGIGYLLGSVDEVIFTIINGVFIMTVSFLGVAGIYKLCKKDGLMTVFLEKAEENDGGLVVKPGMSQVFVFPLAAYVIYYIFSVISRVLVNI